MQGLYNSIELEKVNGEWLINNIYYDDVIREELKAYSEESANSVTYMEDLSDEMNVTSNEYIYTLSAARDMLLLDAAQEVAAYKAEIEEAMNKSDVIKDDGIATTNATLKSYNRTSAVTYARNNVLKETISGFNNYESSGGDCTNFVSACLYNGGIPMD